MVATLAAAIKQSNDNIIIIDPQCHIEYVNQAFEDLTGYKSDEILGKKSSFLCFESFGGDRQHC
ncbi:MAG: PAS domain S-box protein [Spirochaetaceae bacterium]|nr:PAS domain S-box protein [Spirochaetaceae bacterium]